MKVINILTAVLSLLIVLASNTAAENEQWLQYSWSTGAEQAISTISSVGRSIEVSTTRPGNIELPEFKSKQPLFTRWDTPMVKTGGLWIALDNAHQYSEYDLLYIDSDGDGSLKDENGITPSEQDSYFNFFGPIKLVFEGEDGPVTYHLNLGFYNYDPNNKFMYMQTACWYEGTITAGGVKKKCTLIDNNVNGSFSDKGLTTSQCDRIIIGENQARYSTSVGNLLQIDDQLYKLEIARDGAFIKLAKADDVKFGDVNVPKEITVLTVCGENGFFSVPIENGIAKLPVGKYLVNTWQIDRADASNNKWRMTGTGFTAKSVFEVPETGKVNLDIGEPIQSSLAVSQRESQYVFNLTMNGRSSERVTLMFNNAQAREPKLKFLSKDGKYNKAFSLKYG